MLDINWKPIDDRLRAIYASRKRGTLKRLAADYQLDTRVFSERAKYLGLPPLTLKKSSMSAEASQLMVDHYPCSSYKMQKILVDNGFPLYSTTKILHHYVFLRKCGRLPDKDDAMLDNNIYNGAMLQSLMGVSRHSIRHWTHLGLLKSIPPDPNQTGRYELFFSRKAVFEFMKTFPAHWDSKRCDHYWLVDILTNDNTKFSTFRQESAGINENNVTC